MSMGDFGAVIHYMKQLYPGALAYGLDPGIQVGDTGSGTSRTSTLTAWAGPIVNGGSATWTSSVSTTVNWTSQASNNSPTGIPVDGPDGTARNNALYGPGLHALTDKLIAQLGGVV